MSALEQTPLPFHPERRGAPRLRIVETLPVLIGRGDGVLIDLSERGARVRHSIPVRRGATVRVSFEWHGVRFIANAEVLSCRVFALDHADAHRTTYESRFRFLLVTETSAKILSRVLASMESRAVRRWVSNLRGWSDESNGRSTSISRAEGSYLRCRLIGQRWEVKRTHDPAQPDEGFILPENVEQNDVERLCASYLQLDDDGRHLIRLIAAAVVAS